ncbi:MAG TPA: 4-hydroxybenzoate octaprenyltransferase [Spirochaetota bacterium]|nr:4-hydroxybenzoate octaprenyltransferase [Spirochaetota bacterium]HNT12709.1 4-hydroxybenzoate octaprenyltransferase [Spirochaetota bacterium]HNV45767.1 4-hydroxybenzoate octaprenyltransferase [Spirochaetota bacterium]HOS38160.1 4-hydroxybenzoate octaprenyltransferase [Spirochaetota bacterium]HPU88453.1 4-hydroxybenzoate octaprenyltransferase [Spirochaetota bacterium]
MDFRKFANLIMIEQTLFALPFAYIGIVFAGGGSVWTWIWATVAVVAARTAGMAFNRYFDAEIDAKNPRTKNRALPAGEVSKTEVLSIAVASSFFLIVAAYLLNTLCFYLSFLAVGMLATYSLFKRFSSSSHLYLGLIEAAAPVGGYLAVSGDFQLMAFVLGGAIMAWIAGLDIVYAIQDRSFDMDQKLFSVPVRFGVERAKLISAGLYVVSLGALVAAGLLAGKGVVYWLTVICVGLVFIKQQLLARQQDIEEAVRHIFQLNNFVSPVLLAGTVLDLFIKL